MTATASLAPSSSPARSPSGSSWMALVATTTLGLGEVDRLRAEVRSDQLPGVAEGAYRLIVQSYSGDEVAQDWRTNRAKRPLASTQRAITREELLKGVAVDVVHVGEPRDGGADSVVVAWLEAGAPDLEYDALRARPAAGAYYGVTRRRAARSAQIVLNQRAA